jgi:hypothetical protein
MQFTFTNLTDPYEIYSIFKVDFTIIIIFGIYSCNKSMIFKLCTEEWGGVYYPPHFILV